MTVAFLASSSWYLHNFRGSTISAFVAAGHKVVCLVPSREEQDWSQGLIAAGAAVVPIDISATSDAPLGELRGARSVIRAVRLAHPGLIFSFTPKGNLHAAIAGRFLGIPFVSNVSGLGSAEDLAAPKRVLLGAAMRLLFRRAARVLFQNEEDLVAYAQRGWVLPGRCELSPGSGVDLSRFVATVRRQGPITFLLASRLIREKGVFEYGKAARILSSHGVPARFILAGRTDATDRSVTASELAELQTIEAFEFRGDVTDMPGLMSEVDCVVLPSVYREGVPKILLEALAAGKIIITTDRPGCRETISPGGTNGFLVEGQSPAALAAAMRQVIGLSSDQRLEMGRSSRRLAEQRFDEKRVISRYLELAERLASSGSSRPLRPDASD